MLACYREKILLKVTGSAERQTEHAKSQLTQLSTAGVYEPEAAGQCLGVSNRALLSSAHPLAFSGPLSIRCQLSYTALF